MSEIEVGEYVRTDNGEIHRRGDQWLKEIDIIVDGKNLGGILIQEWGEISFRFPFIKNIKYPDIEPYIQDLIKADLVVKE